MERRTCRWRLVTNAYVGDEAGITTILYVIDAANFGKTVTRLLSDDTYILFYTSVGCIGRT